MSTDSPQPTEEELRAAYEEEIKRLRIEHVLLDNVVTIVNLGMRRTGLSPGTEGERDLDQVRLAIESVRALMPVLELFAAENLPSIRQAVSQLQLAYVQSGGSPPAASAEASAAGPATAPEAPGAGTLPTEPPAGQPPAKPGEPGPAERSGRLWVPGQ
jgi:hypothetical protein